MGFSALTPWNRPYPPPGQFDSAHVQASPEFAELAGYAWRPCAVEGTSARRQGSTPEDHVAGPGGRAGRPDQVDGIDAE